MDTDDFTAFFLNLDLRQHRSKLPSVLPPSTVHPTKIYHLQIQSAKDVSRPMVARLDLNEASTFSSPSNATGMNRILRLTLTDGHQDITALELIPCVQLKMKQLLPGTKICLQGHIEMANGMLLLKPSNVSLLGGKVSHLMHKWKTSSSKLDPFLLGIAAKPGAPPPPFVPFVTPNEKNASSSGTGMGMGMGMTPMHAKAGTPLPTHPLASCSVATTKQEEQQQRHSKTPSSRGPPPPLLPTPTALPTPPPPPPMQPVFTFQKKNQNHSMFGCRAIEMCLTDGKEPGVVLLMFELEDEKEQRLSLPASKKLMLMLLGLNAPGAPPIEKLWRSKKGKRYLNERMIKLKAALIKTTTSVYTLSQPLKNVQTTRIVNIE